MQLTHATLPFSRKPLLDSYDSGEECSVDHWLQVCKLVDEVEVSSTENEFEFSHLEESLEETILEVEPAATN